MNSKMSSTIDAPFASVSKKNKLKRSSGQGCDTFVTPPSASASHPGPVVDSQEESGLSQPEGTTSTEQLVEPTVAEGVEVEPATEDVQDAPHESSSSRISGAPRPEQARSGPETHRDESPLSSHER